MAQAYACRIKRSNYDAISSENPNFSLGDLLAWLAIHEDGYFIRDEGRPWDCSYMSLDLFALTYRFENFRPDEMFHPITFS